MIQGKVESHTKAKNAFRIGQTWYNLNPGVPLPDRFDVIAFEPQTGTDGRQYLTQPAQVIEKGQPPSYGGGSGGGSRQGSGGGSKGGYDNLGQQVGNCVTNAVNLVCHGIVTIPEGKTVGDVIKKVAAELMVIGDSVKSQHSAGPANVPVANVPTPPPVQQPQGTYAPPQPQAPAAPQGMQTEDFDDTIPF